VRRNVLVESCKLFCVRTGGVSVVRSTAVSVARQTADTSVAVDIGVSGVEGVWGV
jgi:hypothetical protein